MGPADLVAPHEPDTATGALWKTLRSDRTALYALFALSAAVISDVLALAFSDLGFLAGAADPLRLVIAAVVLKAGLSRIIHREERRFWNTLALAFGFQLLARLILMFAPADNRTVDLVSTVVYAASFLALIVAVERPMKRRRGLQAVDPGVTLTWSGGTIFVFGILFYFVLVPLTFDLPTEDMRLLHFYTFLVFDFYITAKLIYIGRIAVSQRWKMLYSLLVLMMAGFFLVDLLDCLRIAGALSPSWTGMGHLASNLPYLVLILAARLRYHPFPSEGSPFDSVSRKDSLPWPRERLVSYALFFPFIHLTFHFFGLLDPESQPVREGFVLTWLMLFGAMALVQQRMFEKKARSLWLERMRSDEALHKSRESLRLAEERQAAEKALRQSEEKLDKALRSIPDAMLISTVAEGRILEVNESFQDQFGYTREEVLGKTGVELKLWVEPEDRAMMTRLLRERGRVKNLEFKLTKKAGETRLTLLSGEIIDLEGETGILIVLRDITEKRALEDKLRRSRRLESIGTLTSAIAYDLNNVLIPIWTTVRALRQAPLEEKYEPFLTRLEERARHGMDMVRQILTFSGRGGERLAFQPEHLVEDMRQTARTHLPDTIEVRAVVPEEPWKVEGDAGQLHQVLRHLSANACEAMACEETGTLTFEIENVRMDQFYARRHQEAQEGPYVVVTVTDTGRGIPEEDLGKVFDPYFTTKDEKDGNGLGLAICETIVKSHGGFITVYSAVQSGTSFHVYLPATVEEGAGDEAPPELPAGHGECVLVVDDDVAICDIIRETLEAFGYEVLSANNGTEALELYSERRNEIDVVLIDMTMQLMDSESTVKKLRALDPGVTVIAVNGLAARKTGKGYDNIRLILEKPYTAEKLLTSLQDVLTTNV